MRRLLFLLPLLLCGACSSDDEFTPPTAPPGPSVPTIGGTYNSQTMWQLDRTTPAGPEQYICAGGITIANQLGTNFSGTFFIADANCASGVISGSLVGGALQADGAVSFELTLGSESPFMAAVFGCTYVSGDRIVIGTILANQLTAQSTTVMNCQNGQNTVVMRLSGTR